MAPKLASLDRRFLSSRSDSDDSFSYLSSVRSDLHSITSSTAPSSHTRSICSDKYAGPAQSRTNSGGGTQHSASTSDRAGSIKSVGNYPNLIDAAKLDVDARYRVVHIPEVFLEMTRCNRNTS